MTDPTRPALLLVNHQISGSERRYARFFIAASQMGANIHLFINPVLYELEAEAGILVDQYENVIQLPARCHRLLCGKDWLPFDASGVARKIDYALNILDAWRLARRLRITHVHAVVGGIFVGLPFFLDRRFKTIVSVPAVDLRSMASRRIAGLPLLLWLLIGLLRRCDAVDAVSPAVKENLVGRGIPADRIHVAPCTFTDYEHFAPAVAKEDWVVFAGRLVGTKNPLLFVQAIPAIRAAHPGVRFLLFGDGPLREAVEGEIARLGVEGVVAVRYEPDLAPVLARSRVFVSVQVDENYSSQALLEAMACGNAIVASDVGETYRWVDEETGVRVATTPDALAAAVVALFDDPDSLRRKGQRARERASREHTVERFAQYLLGVYAGLV